MNLAFLKKHLVLEICGAVILVLLIFVSLRLYAAMRCYAAEKSALQTVMDRKQQLDRRSPYPSEENVRQEAENSKDILDSYNELNDRLRAQQIEPQAMQPADFMSLRENILRRLQTRLNDAHVIYPPKFAFAFERYAGGKLPAADDVPRLVQQLRIVEALCQTLGKVGVAALVSLSRDEFELSGRTADTRVRNVRGEEALFTTQHFKLAVRANESAVIDLLNLLARLPMFTVVTFVELANLNPTLREGLGAPALAVSAAGSFPAKLAGQERNILLGKELVELKLEMDVYEFAPSLDFKEGADRKK